MKLHFFNNIPVKVILFVLLALSLLNLLKPFTYFSWPDFAVYYQTAQQVFHHTQNSIHSDIYLYPPISLLLFFPFTFFNYVIAGKLWFVFSLGCLILSVWIFLKQHNLHTNFWAICTTGILVCNFFPVKFTFGMGQMNMIVLLLITFAYTKLITKSAKVSGILWSIALTLKYFPIFVPLYFLFRKQWQILLWLLITVCVFFIIGFFLLPSHITIHFFQNTFPSLTTSLKSDYYNQALSGFLLRGSHFSLMEFTILRIGISAILLSITFVVLRTKKMSKDLLSMEISICIILSLLLNAFSWQHHFVFLLLPLGITFVLLQQHKLAWQYYAIVLVSYFLVAANAKNPQSLPTIFQSHVFFGTVLLWGLDLYTIFRFFPNNKQLAT